VHGEVGNAYRTTGQAMESCTYSIIWYIFM